MKVKLLSRTQKKYIVGTRQNVANCPFEQQLLLYFESSITSLQILHNQWVFFLSKQDASIVVHLQVFFFRCKNVSLAGQTQESGLRDYKNVVSKQEQEQDSVRCGRISYSKVYDFYWQLGSLVAHGPFRHTVYTYDYFWVIKYLHIFISQLASFLTSLDPCTVAPLLLFCVEMRNWGKYHHSSRLR